MRLAPEDQPVLEALAGQGEALVAQTLAWCAVNSGSRNLAGLETQRGLLAEVMGSMTGALESLPLRPSLEITPEGRQREQAHTDSLRLTVRPEAPVQVALTGHYDTVYPAESPFQQVTSRVDGALNGPGVADMKGGIAVMLAALRAFESHPLAHRVGYRVLLSPDEEIGSLASAPLLAELGATAQVGLTYEPALSDGGLAGARKGSGNFHLVVRGRAAHAGRDFAAGRNAVALAARLAGELDRLNGKRDGLTLNIARIDGGAPLNMVPDTAVLRFNVRLADADSARFIEGEIDRLVAQDHGEGFSVERHGGFTRPPKPFDAAQQALFGKAREAGALIGQALTWKPSGGVCEGNNLHAAGVPNIDTLGVRGGDIHSEAEYAWPDSFAERAQLSALLLMKLASGEIDAAAIKGLRDNPGP